MEEYIKSRKEDIQVLFFKMNGVYYGIPVELSIKEVAMFDEKNFKRTIESQENVIGSIILRDKMIAILDLKQKYNLEKNDTYEKGIVVLKKYGTEEEKLLGLLIDDKLDIRDVNVSKIEKKEGNLKEIFGYTKIKIEEDKEEFLILLDGNVFFDFDCLKEIEE